MPIALKLREDPAPSIARLAGLVVERELLAAPMAALQGRVEKDISDRFALGHRAYVARMHGVAAAWGWVATSSAAVGELGTVFSIGNRERYLWNFVTRAEFRGMGIYPRLINSIVDAELADADRFWIAYAPENHASGSGIGKAGFTTIAEMSFDRSGHPALRAIDPSDHRVANASTLTGIPSIEDALAQCWRCVRLGRTLERSCAPGKCSCDYRKPEQHCAA